MKTLGKNYTCSLYENFVNNNLLVFCHTLSKIQLRLKPLVRLIRFVVNVTVVLFDCRNMGYFYLKLPLLKYNERYLENQIED